MKRDAEYIKSRLIRKDGKIYCKEKTTIEFPKWYLDKELAKIEEQCLVYGIMCISMGDKYSVSVIPTLCYTVPVMINEIERDGVEYVQFMYGEGDEIINNDKSIKHELLSYYFFEGFFVYARIPWYLEYEDMVRVMDNLPKYAKSGVGGNWLANELLVGYIARSKADKNKFFRQDMKSGVDYVELMNVYYSVKSPVLKLGGNYFTSAMTSAIVQKNDTETKLEKLARV